MVPENFETCARPFVHQLYFFLLSVCQTVFCGGRESSPLSQHCSANIPLPLPSTMLQIFGVTLCLLLAVATGSKNTMDFAIIGVQKAGTTYLKSILIKHPMINLNKRELHFWDNCQPRLQPCDHNWTQLLRNGIADHNSTLASSTAPANCTMDKWVQLLSSHPTDKLWGDKTPRYVAQPQVCVTRMAGCWRLEPLCKHDSACSCSCSCSCSRALYFQLANQMISAAPDLKVIVILRNPVDRAWSGFRMDRSLAKRASKKGLSTWYSSSKSESSQFEQFTEVRLLPAT